MPSPEDEENELLDARPNRSRAVLLANLTEGIKYRLGRGARLSFDQVHHVARLATGFDDPGGTRYEEGLRHTLEASTESDLNPVGRRAMHDTMWTGVALRMMLTEAQRRRPEVFKAPLRPPLLVMGMARTGTTHMQRLLSLDPAFYGPPFWELTRPYAQEGEEDNRQAKAHEAYADRRTDISFDHIHHVAPDAPEECQLLKMAQQVSMMPWVGAPVYSYVEWLRSRPVSEDDWVYREYRDFLLLIQDQHPGAALCLKSPCHTQSLRAIERHVPEAMIVNTVRDPVEWANSAQSLVLSRHCFTANRIDLPRMVATNTAGYERMWEEHVSAREDTGVAIIDIHHDDLVQRPVEVVRSIYEFHGIHWPVGHDDVVQRYVDDNPRYKHGKHTYSSEDFGLSDRSVSERFADYIDYFGLRSSAMD